jgi:predicted HAD superfamily phosphohydrolase YqeG
MLTLAGNHFLQTVNGIKTGKYLQHSMPKEEIKLAKKNPKFKTVFLDLDETLVHCDENAKSYTVKL